MQIASHLITSIPKNNAVILDGEITNHAYFPF